MVQLTINTGGPREAIDITPQVRSAVRSMGVREGLCLVFVPHTTAGVFINETHDPAVRADIMAHLLRLVPRDLTYGHTEGNADAHIKSVLVGNSVLLPVRQGDLALGQWQGVVFCEFDGPRQRKVMVSVIPEKTQTAGN